MNYCERRIVMIFEFEDYTIDVCEEKMKTLEDRKYRCECPICRVFREYANTFSNDVKRHFDALGLELENPDEVYDLGKDEKGNTKKEIKNNTNKNIN